MKYPVAKEEFIKLYHKYKNKYLRIDVHESDLEFNIRYALSRCTSKSIQEVDYCISKWIH